MRSVGSWVVIVAVFTSLAGLAAPARAGTAADEPAAAATEDAAAEGATATAAAAGAAVATDAPAGTAGTDAPAGATVRRAVLGRVPPDPASVFAPAPARSRPDAPFALAVNMPWAWMQDNIGGSAYIAIDPHWAMRANFARYDAEELLPLLLTGGEGPIYDGNILDLGLGWIWYPRRLWDGFTFEAGALMRDRDVRRSREDDPDLDIQTTTYAGRAMIGWSWLAAGTVFLSVAAGASAGLEHGREAFVSERGMSTTRSTDRLQIDFETYVRVGFAFGR
jgi:hypothetical protein